MLQLQVTNSPFNESQAELLNQLLPTLTHSQQVWLSGYLSALSLLGDTGQAGPAVLPLLLRRQQECQRPPTQCHSRRYPVR